MGIDYSYDCIQVQNVRPLDTFDNKQLFLADVQFEDEHEHPLALLRDVLVVLEDGEAADLADYPENFLSEEAYDDRDTNRKYHQLCKNFPGYRANDTVAFAEQLLAALPPDPNAPPTEVAADRIADHDRKPLSTHQLARLLLELPEVPLQTLLRQGGPQSWSPELYPGSSVQVGVRSW